MGNDKVLVNRALGYIVPLCVLSLLICAATVSVANDMYAFVKSGDEVNINITDAENIDDVAKLLEDEGIINNPAIFSLYVKRKGKEETLVNFRGEVVLSPSMSYREILSSFS